MYKADKLFINGEIYTLKEEGDKIEAVAVNNGKIVFTGSNKEAENISAEEVIDLKGNTVLPGFTDTHMHLGITCYRKQSIDLLNAKSINDVIEKIKNKAEQTIEGEWITAINLHKSKLSENRFPLRWELDKASVKHPILISSYCGHANMVNSLALELAEIKKGFVPSVEGIIEFDKDGEPNGIVRENAYDDYFAPLNSSVPLADYKKRKLEYENELKRAASLGITTLHTYSSLTGDPLEYLYLYQDLEKENRLPVRIVMSSSAELPKSIGAKTGLGNEKVKYGAKKIFCDGSLSSHSAALLEPYSDEPDKMGVLMNSQDELNKQFKEAYDYGMEIAVHAIGDKGVEMVLNAIEEVYYENPRNDARFRIIHALVLNKNQINRMKKLPVILDMQPIFMKNWVDLAEKRIGKERIQLFMPFKTLIDEDIIVTGGSDLPVEDINAFIGIQCIVTRQNLEGYPEGGFVPKERVSVYEAIEMFTKNAAYCSYEENIKGTIEIGKLADFIIIDRNIFDIDLNEISRIKVIKTYLGGEEVFSI